MAERGDHARVVQILARPERVVRVLVGARARDSASAFGDKEPRLVAEVEELRAVVDVAQELHSHPLVEPHRVAVALPFVSAVKGPRTPRRLECARVALHAMAVPHNRHAVRPYLAESKASLLGVHDASAGVDQLRHQPQERKLKWTPQRRILPLRLFRERDELFVLREDCVAEGATRWTVHPHADPLLAIRRLYAHIAKRSCRTRLQRHLADCGPVDGLVVACLKDEKLLFAGTDEVCDVRLESVLVAVLPERRRLLPVDVEIRRPREALYADPKPPAGDGCRDRPPRLESRLRVGDFGRHRDRTPLTRPSSVHPHEFAEGSLRVAEGWNHAEALASPFIAHLHRGAILARCVLTKWNGDLSSPVDRHALALDAPEFALVEVGHRHRHLGRADGPHKIAHLRREKSVRIHAADREVASKVGTLVREQFLRRECERLLGERQRSDLRVLAKAEHLAGAHLDRPRLDGHHRLPVFHPPCAPAREIDDVPLMDETELTLADRRLDVITPARQTVRSPRAVLHLVTAHRPIGRCHPCDDNCHRSRQNRSAFHPHLRCNPFS